MTWKYTTQRYTEGKEYAINGMCVDGYLIAKDKGQVRDVELWIEKVKRKASSGTKLEVEEQTWQMWWGHSKFVMWSATKGIFDATDTGSYTIILKVGSIEKAIKKELVSGDSIPYSTGVRKHTGHKKDGNYNIYATEMYFGNDKLIVDRGNEDPHTITVIYDGYDEEYYVDDEGTIYEELPKGAIEQ